MTSVPPAWAIAATAFPTVPADPVSVTDGSETWPPARQAARSASFISTMWPLVNVQVALTLGELVDHIEPRGPTGHLADRVGTLAGIGQVIRCRRPRGAVVVDEHDRSAHTRRKLAHQPVVGCGAAKNPSAAVQVEHDRQQASCANGFDDANAGLDTVGLDGRPRAV
jgi:hypothetical protein